MSLFQLKTSEAQLASANRGVTDTEWRQFAPSRDVTDDNFHNGAIHIRFDIGGDRWWVPKDSYLRCRLKVEERGLDAGNNGVWGSVTANSGIALNMFPMSCLFSSMEFRINDKVISRITENVAQVEALEHRMGKSKAWMDSVGLTVLNPSPSDRARQAYVSYGGASVSNTCIRTAAGPNSACWAPAPYTGNNAMSTVAVAGAEPAYIAFAFGGNTGEIHNIFTPGELIYLLNLGNYTGYARVIKLTSNRIYVDAALQATNNQTLALQIRRGSVDIVEDENLPGTSYVELMWKPCLSLFKIPHALPLGHYELILVPHPNPIYKYRLFTTTKPNTAISITDKWEPDPAALNNGQLTVGVDSFFLYVATLRSSPTNNYAYLIDLEDTKCLTQNFTNGTSFNQEQFTVSPSTYALTLAFQDNRAGNGTPTDIFYSATKFKCGQTEEELTLERMFINFGGMNKPQPDADPLYVRAVQPSSGVYKDMTMSRYYENIIQTRGYFNDGGHETWGEWKKRGPYYHFNWPRDGTDRSQRVMVNYQFRQAITSSAKILLFSHYRQVAKVRIENGNVTDVQCNEY